MEEKTPKTTARSENIKEGKTPNTTVRTENINHNRPSTIARFNPQAFHYDIYKTPASLKEAEMHQKANSFAVPVPDSEKCCPCCNQICEVYEFGYFANVQNISNVSPTVSLYFSFLFFAIFLLLISFLFNSIILFADQPGFLKCFVETCPVETKPMEEFFKNSEVNRVLSVSALFVMIAARHIFHRVMSKKYEGMTLSRISADDFSVLMHVPEYKTESKIKEDIELHAKQKHISCEVVKVNKVYNLRSYIQMIENYGKTDMKMRRMRQKQKEGTNAYAAAIEDKRFVVTGLEEFLNTMSTLEGETRYFTKIAFVTFGSNYQRLLVQKTLKKKLQPSRTAPREYWAEDTDEPDNYLWANFGTTIGYKIIMRVVMLIASILCWAITWLLLFLLDWTSLQIQFTSLSVIPTIYMNIFFNLVVTIMQIIFKLVMGFLTEKENFFRESSKRISLTWKCFIVSFVNTAISLMVFNYLREGNNLASGMWSDGGIVSGLMLNMVFDLAFNIIAGLWSPIFLLGAWRRHRLTKKARSAQNTIMQIDLNNAYEKKEFDVSESYTDIFYIMSLVFFYQPVAPYAAVMGIFSLFVQFTLNRYILFNRSSRSKNFSFQFTNQMFIMLDMCMMIYGLAVAFFHGLLVESQQWYQILLVTLGLGNFLYGLLTLYSNSSDMDISGPEMLFAEHSKNLASDYDRTNPLTASKAMEAWLACMDPLNVDKQMLRVIKIKMAAETHPKKIVSKYMGLAQAQELSLETEPVAPKRLSGEEGAAERTVLVKNTTNDAEKRRSRPSHFKQLSAKTESTTVPSSRPEKTPHLQPDVYFSSS